MSKYDLNNTTTEEHYFSSSDGGSNKRAELVGENNDFESSLQSFSSANVVKKRRKKKRGLGVNGLVRLFALCICIGVLVFSVSKIFERTRELSAAKAADALLHNTEGDSEVPRQKPSRPVSSSKDLLTYLGSGSGGIEMVDTDTLNYYDTLREKYLNAKAINSDCIGVISVSGTRIELPIYKGKDNYYYLTHLANGEINNNGEIFADYRLDDDYDKNMNSILYGHCMTSGERFRPIKWFFDSDTRYTQAQEMKITVVTDKAIYIYEYFSGYRSEGAYFINTFTTKSSKTHYYNFLKNLRARNTISKEVGYNSNSKIITLVTCTNLASKPDERYVLHGILDEYYEFES